MSDEQEYQDYLDYQSYLSSSGPSIPVNDYPMPASTEAGSPVGLLDDLPASPALSGEIRNPPIVNSPEVIGAKAKQALPIVAETGANLAGLAIPGGPLVKGLGGFALEQGMNHLLQTTGLKEDAPLGQDALDAGISAAFNLAPATGSLLKAPYARKLGAATKDYAISEALFQPISQSKMGRAYAKTLKDTQKYVLESGLLKGSVEFDSATGKFLQTGKEAPKDLQTIYKNVNSVLNGDELKGTKGLLTQRDEILDRIDQATAVYNQGKAIGSQIQGIKASDFEQAMQPLKDKVSKLSTTPGISGDIATSISESYQSVLNDIASFKGSNPTQVTRANLWSGGQSSPMSIATGNLSPKDANTVISNIYERARRLEAFARDAADPLTKQAAEDGADVLLESAAKLRGLRDQQIGKVLNKLQSAGGLSDVTPKQVQNINDAIHNLLNFKDSGLTPALDAIIPKAGARAMLTSEADNVAKPSFNQTGLIQSAWDKLVTPFGYGADTVSDRLSASAAARLRAIQGYNDQGLPSVPYMTGSLMSSPVGQGAAVYGNMARKKESPNALAEIVAAQGLEHGVEAPAPVPIQLPRTVEGVDLNQMQYVLTLKILGEQGILDPEQASIGTDLMALPPEIQPMVQEANQIAGGMVSRIENVLKFGNRDDKRAEYASVAKQFPDAFPPPRTGISGEIEVDGKPALVLPEDKVQYTRIVKDSSLSEIEKTRILHELNKSGKVLKVVK